ncbi:hypothetical protein D3C76_1018460 [compost metagenome]
MAREMAATATHRLLEPAAMITPMMQQANRNMDISRALIGLTPRPIRNEERMPPPTLPKSAVR